MTQDVAVTDGQFYWHAPTILVTKRVLSLITLTAWPREVSRSKCTPYAQPSDLALRVSVFSGSP